MTTTIEHGVERPTAGDRWRLRNGDRIIRIDTVGSDYIEATVPEGRRLRMRLASLLASYELVFETTAAMVLERHEQTSEVWYEDRSEVVSFGRVYHELEGFGDVSDIFYYFEKPHKWTHEYERWVALGRPTADQVELEQIDEAPPSLPEPAGPDDEVEAGS